MKKVMLTLIVLCAITSAYAGSFDLVVVSDDVKESDKIEQAVAAGAHVMFFSRENESPKQLIKRIADKSRELKSKINTLAIVTHGEEGMFSFGNKEITAENMDDYKAEFYTLHAYMENKGNILLYSCLSGKGEKGQLLVEKFAKRTYCKVFASDDVTGKKGDWNLEVASGDPTYKDILDIKKLAREYKSTLQTVLLPGFTLTTYVSGLPMTPSNITIDSVSRTIYYAEDGDTEGVLRKVDTLLNVTLVTSDFTPSIGFYPFVATDIHYANGYVYCALTESELVEIDVVTGLSTIIHTFPFFAIDIESGMDIKDDTLIYVTDGWGNSDAIWEYNLNTAVEQQVVTGIPMEAQGLEYETQTDTFYFAPVMQEFYNADVQAGTFNLISPAQSGQGNFAVEPGGQYLYARVNGEIIQVEIATGTTTTFITGLNGLPDEQDLAFGPSNAGCGLSLYIADATNILECYGFNTSFSLGFSVNDVSCVGGNDGAVDLTITGVPPFTFAWSTGATTEDISGLSIGTYIVTVSDTSGCVKIDSVVVNEPTPLITSITGTDVSCPGGNDGAADLTVLGGTTPYIFAWSTGATTEDISGLIAGTYLVTVTDSCSIVAINSITISDPPALTGTIAGTDVSCFGGNDGAADLTVAGGTPPYTYIWITGPTTEDISGLIAGTYSVIVTDSCGVISANQVFILEPPLLAANILSPTNVSCNGGNDGAATVNATGGTPGYSYSWPLGGTNQTTTGLPAGWYLVTVTDANGCTTMDSVMITEPTALALGFSHIDPVGGCTGTVTANVTGGTPGYYYLWDDPSSQTDQTADSLCAGQYCVTVTDNNGCTITSCDSITVGIDETHLSASIDIYPNPFNSKITIVSKAGTKIDNISISDILGKEVFNEEIKTVFKSRTYDLGSYPPGLYFITLVTEQEKITNKIVKL